MKCFYSISALLAVVGAQDGTCTAGQDQLNVEQSCLGRCHIFYPGDYGACNSYQFSESDISGPCGDSPANACKSTFNVNWDAGKTNCGNCYYVELPYADGTKRGTYIQVVDTNANEVKFEVGQQAWKNLCPYVCAGTGECGYTPEFCNYGTLADTGAWNGNISCAVQHAPITFRRVDCSGSITYPTEGPVNTPPIVLPSTVVTNPIVVPPTSTSTSQGTPGVVQPTNPPVTVPPVIVPTVAPTNPPVVPPASSAPVVGGNAIEVCKQSVGSINVTWDEECKSLCEFYAAQPLHCPGGNTSAGLTECVSVKHPYCKK